MNTPQASPDLASLRVQIDNIDQQLLTLLNQRALVAERVGEVKKREGTPFFRPDRVSSIRPLRSDEDFGMIRFADLSWKDVLDINACVECGRRSAGRARGWRAYLVESDDNPLLDEVVCYCASCAMREFGNS